MVKNPPLILKPSSDRMGKHVPLDRERATEQKGLMEMKKILTACLAVVTMILMASCGGKDFKPHVMTKADIGAVRISDGAKIEYGMKRTDVEKILGQGEENAVQSAAITYDEGKISVFYRRNETESAENVSDQQTVAGVMLNAQSAGAYQTPRGLEAGKTVQEVLDAYGEYPGIRSELSLSYQYDMARKKMIAPDQNNLDRDMGLKNQVIIQFTLNGEEVASISMMDRQMALQMN